MDVNGMESMSHFSFESEDFLAYKAYFVQLMLDQNILASNLCYLMAAHTLEDVDIYLTACDNAFKSLAEARDKDDVRQRLRGDVAASGFKRLA